MIHIFFIHKSFHLIILRDVHEVKFNRARAQKNNLHTVPHELSFYVPADVLKWSEMFPILFGCKKSFRTVRETSFILFEQTNHTKRLSLILNLTLRETSTQDSLTLTL